LAVSSAEKARVKGALAAHREALEEVLQVTAAERGQHEGVTS
jgi:hypothetical protein